TDQEHGNAVTGDVSVPVGRTSARDEGCEQALPVGTGLNYLSKNAPGKMSIGARSLCAPDHNRQRAVDWRDAGPSMPGSPNFGRALARHAAHISRRAAPPAPPADALRHA